jgi:hypothetical protein
LSGIDPLALPAIALAEELFELMLEFGVEMNLLAERLQRVRPVKCVWMAE